MRTVKAKVLILAGLAILAVATAAAYWYVFEWDPSDTVAFRVTDMGEARYSDVIRLDDDLLAALPEEPASVFRQAFVSQDAGAHLEYPVWRETMRVLREQADAELGYPTSHGVRDGRDYFWGSIECR